MAFRDKDESQGDGVVNVPFTLLGSDGSLFVFTFGYGFKLPTFEVRRANLERRASNAEHATEPEHEPRKENPEE
jgi:hypothetical protein